MNRLFKWTAPWVVVLTWLLCLQWPLREWVGMGSREANDLGQVVFALYVAVAISAASRHGAHLAIGNAPAARWRHWAVWACTAPWALFMLWSYSSTVWRSVAQLEHFPETSNPGYFFVKLAACVMALLVLVEPLRALRSRP
jgi:hypothetical protein